MLALIVAVALTQAPPGQNANDQPDRYASGQGPTFIEDPKAADLLMGEHVFSLQWIDNPPGRARITEKDKELFLDAEQKNAKGDVATVKGKIVRVTDKTFELDGTIVTKVSFIYGGKACEKSGRFTFRITGKRKYWRLREMDNCEGNAVVDYVDVFFERPTATPRK